MPPPKQGSPDPGSGSQRQHSRSSSMETVKIDPTDEDFEFMEPISPQTSPYEHIYLAGGQPRVARHNLAIAGLEPRSKEPASKVETPVPTPSNAETSPPTKPKTAVAKAYFYSPVVKYGPNGRYVQAVLDRNVPLSGVLPVSKREEADKKHEELVKKCNELGAEFTNILNLDGSAPADYLHFAVKKPEHANKSFKLEIPFGGCFAKGPDDKAQGEKMVKQGDAEAGAYLQPTLATSGFSMSQHFQQQELNSVAHSALQEARDKRLVAEKTQETTNNRLAAEKNAAENKEAEQKALEAKYRAAKKHAQETQYSDKRWKQFEDPYGGLSPPTTPPGMDRASLLGRSKAAQKNTIELQGPKLAPKSSNDVLAQEIAEKIRVAEAGTEIMEKKESVTTTRLSPGSKKTIESIFINPDLHIGGEVPVMFTDVTSGVIPDLKVDEKKGRISYTCLWSGRKVTEDGWGLTYFCPHFEERMMTRFSTPTIAMGKCCEDKIGFTGNFDRFSSW